jgi:hypothetical protein
MIRIRRVALVLAVIVVTVLGIAGAWPAHASSVLFPAPHGGPGTPPGDPVASVAGGMPGWQIALIAIAASLVSATAAVLVYRARTTRSRVSVTDARQAKAATH